MAGGLGMRWWFICAVCLYIVFIYVCTLYVYNYIIYIHILFTYCLLLHVVSVYGAGQCPDSNLKHECVRLCVVAHGQGAVVGKSERQLVE